MDSSDKLLEKYVILKLLNNNEKITRYKLRQLFVKHGFLPGVNTFYFLMENLRKKGLIRFISIGTYTRIRKDNTCEKLDIIACEITKEGKEKLKEYEDRIRSYLI
ncbi:MAG: hypothetical protein ACPLKS_04845 [Caldisericum exile]|uniref:hypothetical protein n=1 Tax=Caldisericum exile TaxID=693075 RepID=UPI003C750EA9